MNQETRTPEEPIAHLLDSYRAAVYAKDVDAFIALYDTDVQVFDMWERWSCSGIDAWRALVTEWFDSLGTGRVAVRVDDLCIHAAQDLAAAHAFLTYTGLSAEGTELRSLDNRLTLVAKQRGPVWKIVHEHTSAPAESDTTKVRLRRIARA